MTIEEFRQIEDIDQLYDWCYDNDETDYFENMISRDVLDDYITEDIRSALDSNWGWMDIYRSLYDIDEEYSWYTSDGGLFEYSGVGYYETRELRDQILDDLGDDPDYFDQEEDAEEEEHIEPPEPEIEEVDLDAFGEMNSDVWGTVLAYRRPEEPAAPSESSTHQKPEDVQEETAQPPVETFATVDLAMLYQ